MPSSLALFVRRAAAAALTLFMATAAAVAQDWRGPVAIEVVVDDSRGKDLFGAEVRLVYLAPSGGGVLPSVTTDAGGKVAIGGLAAGRWMIEIRHPGHMTYRAEIALSADNRPSVLSAAQEMAPGATGTMRVKLNRSKVGAPLPVREASPAVAPPPPRTQPAPSVPAPRPVETAPVTSPAPSPAAPARPTPPVVASPVAAAPQTSPAPAKEAPARTAPAPVPPPVAKPAPSAAATPAAPAPQPKPAAPIGPPATTAPATVAAPEARPAPPTPVAPAPQPKPAAPIGPPATTAPATVAAPETRPASPTPVAPAPQPKPAAPIGPPSTTAPTPVPAPVVKPAPPVAPAATPAPQPKPVAPLVPPAAPLATAAPEVSPEAEPPAPSVAVAPAPPARQRLCVECAPGESAQWGEALIEGGASAGCPSDLRQQFDTVALYGDAGFAALNAALGPGCRAIRVELPAGARFTGFRYEASGGAVTADCLPGRDCPAGGARFPFEPVIRREGGRTSLLVAFESTAAEPRAAVVAGYFSFTRK